MAERTHWHGSARHAHLHHMTAPTDLSAGLPTLLTIHDIASLLRLHRTAAYARTREPDFPDPLVISGACYRWYTHEVLAYVDARRTPKPCPGLLHAWVTLARSQGEKTSWEAGSLRLSLRLDWDVANLVHSQF